MSLQAPARQPLPPRGGMLVRLARLLSPDSTPGKLRLLMLGLVVASLAWGAAGAWVVGQHASAAADVVSTSEPLSLTAQDMYQKLADADVTATTAFLGGAAEPLRDRQRYQGDIAAAAADLSQLKAAASGGDAQLGASLATVSATLPVYTGYVSQAQTSSSLGYPLTGGSFIQVASETMHLTLLPAASRVYADENARLAADSAQAAGLPWVAVLLVGAVVVGFAFYRGQRWLFRRTRRVVNAGLAAASVALVVATLWLAVAYGVARADLGRATGHGSAPAETLAQAGIAVQQARGYQVLNLISRSGATSFTEDFQVASKQVGPGPGSLLSHAAASSAGDPGASSIAAAVRDINAWYQVNNQVQGLDKAANYAAETTLVAGTGTGQSGSGFDRVETDLGQAISAAQVIFRGSATAGDGAYAGLQIGIIVLAILMAAGAAWGVSRRLAEYR